MFYMTVRVDIIKVVDKIDLTAEAVEATTTLEEEVVNPQQSTVTS